MVKLSALVILQRPATKDVSNDVKPIILSAHVDGVGGMAGWLYKDSVREFALFFAKLLAQRTQPGYRQQVTKDQFVGYVHVRSDGLTGVCVADAEYPIRVAFDLIRLAVQNFSDKYSKDAVTKATRDGKDYCLKEYDGKLKELMTKYQDPTKVDKIMIIQKNLDETKEVLGQAMEKLLQRGEDLDSLIEKSDELSNDSKAFYRQAKKSAGCCAGVFG